MAARKIIWSHSARQKLYRIFEFYNHRNKSNSYSNKLNKKFQKELSLLRKHPELGVKTDDDSVRGLIVGEFIIFYESTETTIHIHSVWDCRQNPDDVRMKDS